MNIQNVQTFKQQFEKALICLNTICLHQQMGMVAKYLKVVWNLSGIPLIYYHKALLTEELGDVEAEQNSDSDVESDVGSDHELIYSEDSDEED